LSKVLTLISFPHSSLELPDTSNIRENPILLSGGKMSPAKSRINVSPMADARQLAMELVS
jgi:hypothetical protein